MKHFKSVEIEETYLRDNHSQPYLSERRAQNKFDRVMKRSVIGGIAILGAVGAYMIHNQMVEQGKILSENDKMLGERIEANKISNHPLQATSVVRADGNGNFNVVE